jgi:hypothetical protein
MSYLGDLLFFRRDRVDLDAVLRHRAEVKVRELVDALPEGNKRIAVQQGTGVPGGLVISFGVWSSTSV